MGLVLMGETEVEIGVQCSQRVDQASSFGKIRWVPRKLDRNLYGLESTIWRWFVCYRETSRQASEGRFCPG
jgi:hypothetical protein